MLHPRSLHPAHFCRCPDSLRSVQYPQGARAVAEDGIHRAAATNAQLERLRKAVQSNAGIAVTFTVEMMRHEYLHDLVLWHKSKRRLSHAEWKPHLDGHLSVGARLLIGDIKLTLDCH